MLNETSGHGLGNGKSARLREAESDETLPDSGSEGGLAFEDRGGAHKD